MKPQHITLLAIFLATASMESWALAPYGANISYALIAKEPEKLNGYQIMLNYHPKRYNWEHINLYVDGGFSHFWVNDSAHNSGLNIYSIAPVLRYTLNKRGIFTPYLEVSVGLSYLNHTRIEKRKLGIHFAFQDRLGVGAMLGASEQFSIGVHAVHYSNARLSGHNSGITIPLVLDLGYRFD